MNETTPTTALRAAPPSPQTPATASTGNAHTLPAAAAAVTAAPPGIPVLAIAALACAAMASGVAMRVSDALLPRLAQAFAISIGEASQVITVFAIAYGLSQLVFGPMGDRYGKYRVIAWACVASAGTSLLCALAPDHHTLLVARLLAGATAAAVIPLSMAWIGDVVPYERRQPVLARFLIGQMTGFALGVWMGGYAAEHWAWQTPFFVIAGIFVAVATALHGVRRRLPAAAQAVQPPSGPVLARMVGEFGAVLVKPWARVVLLTVFLEGAAVYGPFAFIATHLHVRHGLPLSTVGGLVMLFALGGFSFALGAQTLVRRLGERWLVYGGASVMAIALLAVALAPAWWWAMPACYAMGLGFYMLHNTLQTHATQMAPERRGAAVASFASCFFLGQSLGVGVCGLLVGWSGTAWLIAVGAVSLVAIGWNFNRAKRVLLPAGA